MKFAVFAGNPLVVRENVPTPVQPPAAIGGVMNIA
jgi:hypothetical protein